MKNIEMEVKGKKLLITVDLDKDFGASTSGKNTIIGSSEGNQTVPGTEGVKIGINVYKPR